MPRNAKFQTNRRARPRKSSVSSTRDAAARKWLKQRATSVAADKSQQKLHADAERYIGALSGGHPADAKSVRRRIRLCRKSGRSF